MNFIIMVLGNIISTFFQSGIWVVGFFFLLVKTFENKELKKASGILVGISLVILFFYSVLVNL
ncbi:hypothetical protein ABE021_06395 [Sporosarcina gallistercoris]|uniref:hypothetical protein n=1 Tax=Sporosarcina gallistercoris TaxID=2762245 RepID=UPI003D2E8D5B